MFISIWKKYWLTTLIESTPNKKNEIDVKDKEDDIYFHGWNIK